MTPGHTSADRSARRFQLARLAVAFGGLERGIGSAASLLRIPLLIWGLELYQYGLYMAILGVVAAANLLDFGLHFGVLNAVSNARGRDDFASIKKIVATAFVIYSGIAVIALCLLVAAVDAMPMGWLLSVPPEQEVLARNVALLGFAGVILPMPFKVFAGGLHGFQKQYVVAAFRSVLHLVGFIVLAVAVVMFPKNLILVVAVNTVIDVLSWAILSFVAVRLQPELALRLEAVSRALAPSLTATGLGFFVINISNMFKFTLGNTVVSHGLGPAAVPSLSVAMALFMTAHSLAGMAADSLWPAYGEASARGEWLWVQRAFGLGAKAALGVAGAFATLGGLLGDLLIDLWTPADIEVSRTLLLYFAIWLLSQTCFSIATSLLSGLNRVPIVMGFAVVEGVSVLVLSIWLVDIMGVEGVALAMMISGVASASLCLGVAVPIATKKRVRTPWRTLARVALCIVLSAGIGAWLRSVFGDVQPLIALVGVGSVAGVVYVGAAWSILLVPNERERVAAWVGRRFDSIRAA